MIIVKRKLYTSRASKVLKNRKAIEEGLKALGKDRSLITRSGQEVDILTIPGLKDKVLRAGRKAERDIIIPNLKKTKSATVFDRINYRKNRFIDSAGNSKPDHYTLSYSRYSGNNRPDRILREGHGLSKDYTLWDNIKRSFK